jgi:cell division protein FtsX
MDTFLLVFVIVLAVGLLGVILYIWNQMNNTESRLIQIIENRIALSKVSSELDNIKSIDDIKEDEEVD